MLLSGGTAVDTTSLGNSSGTLLDGSEIQGGAGLHISGAYASYAALYRAQPWVHTLVRKLAVGGSRLPSKTYQRTGSGRTLAQDSPYGDLMRRPCGYRFGRKFLWLWTFSTYELYGESMWLKLRDDNRRVRELAPMHPANVLTRFIDGQLYYGFMGGGAGFDLRALFPASDVVHFRGYNPDNLLRGVSPCEPLRHTLYAEDQMRRTSSAMWRNGARAGVVLTHEKELSEPAAKRLKAAWDAMHSGADNAGKTAVLEEGVTPHVMQMNPEDMQYVEGRRLNREECCAVWDVPPPAVHILDRATFSNITEQMRSLYRESHEPRLSAHEDTLATQLAPDFDASGDTYHEFDLDGVLRGDYEKRTPANAQAIGTGQATPNEVRRRENLPDVEGGDELLINAALIPLRLAGRTNPPVTDPADTDTTAADRRTLAGRLARVVSVHDVDEDLVLTGLTSDMTAVRALLRAAKTRDTDVTTLRRQIAAALTATAADAVTAEELTET